MKLFNDPISYLFKHLWRFSEGNRRHFVLFIVLSLIANAINLAEPLITAQILNIVQEQGVTSESYGAILFWLGAFVAIGLAFWVFHGPSRVMEHRNAFLARLNVRKHLLGGVLALPAEWHTDHHSGDTIDKVEKGAHATYDFGSQVFELTDLGIRFTGAIAILFWFSFTSGLTLVGFIVVIMTMIVLFDRVLIRQLRILLRFENQITAKVYDTISNITTIIILRIQKVVLSDIVKTMFKPLKLFIRNQAMSETKWFLVTLTSSLMLFCIMALYLWQSISAGTVLLVGTVYALFGYLMRATEGFYRFAYVYGERVKYKTQISNAEELSDDFVKMKRIKQVRVDQDWKTLGIQDCQFSYEGEEGDVHIDGVSMDIRHGEKIAFIGESGSGKTTMLKLIRGLYIPQSVTVCVDGDETEDGFESISDSIALIPQDPEIFTATIKNNITMGIARTMKEVHRFTDLAEFTRVAEGLPNGFDSSIVERGVNLSGGEKQRLALARGLMASEDKEIVLMDEPTSSVDAMNELKIFRNVFEQYPTKTIIASVHRLHLLALFDRVYMFDNGRVIASGTSDQLLSTSPEFKELWDEYQKQMQ
ncbi:MAG: ABC transporter ATP-binding protein [Candidatus Kerfeldbacteria bacterium]